MPGFIPDEIVSDVRNAANIVDVVSDHVALKKAGKNFVGLCPFHADNKPSFTVSPDKQIFHCFGCGQGGNVFTFVMQYNNLSFPESVAFLARRYGINIPTGKLTQAQKKELKERDELLAINSEAADFFRNTLLQSPLAKPARDYLDRRRMPPEISERFMLGYAPRSWNALTQYFSKKGMRLEAVQRAGLVVEKEREGGYYDRFRDRIIFPITDIHERVVGFGGRCLDESLPKYLNSPETLVYQKSRTLYGLNAARESCRRNGFAFIVEGYFDLLALHCHGIDNVVATLGTALTRQHLRTVKGYAPQVILVFDSDEAGIKAAERSLPMLMEEKFDARVLVLPDGADPDSYVFSVGESGFRKAAAEGLGVMPFLMMSAIKKHGLSLEGKVRIVDALKEPLGSLSDSVSRSVYIRDLAERLDIDEAAIVDQVRRAAPKEKKAPPPVTSKRGSRLEEALIAIMLQYPEIIFDFNPEDIIEGFETAELKNLGRMILDRSGSNHPLAGADLIAQTDNPQIRNLISSLSMGGVEPDRESCCKIVFQYQAILRKRRIRELSKKIKEAEKADNQELLNRLLAEKQESAQRHLQALQ